MFTKILLNSFLYRSAPAVSSYFLADSTSVPGETLVYAVTKESGYVMANAQIHTIHKYLVHTHTHTPDRSISLVGPRLYIILQFRLHPGVTMGKGGWKLLV